MGDFMSKFYYFLAILGVAGILDTAILLFYVNCNIGIIFPGLVGIILVLISALKLKLRKQSPLFKNRKARFLYFIILICFGVSFITIESMVVINGYSNQDIEADYLIILGAGVKGDSISLTLKNRLNKGIEYANRYDNTKIVVSGGRGEGEDISEAKAMKQYLIEHGIKNKRIIEEDRATSTMENFKYTKELLKNKLTKNTKVIIVSNEFHMMRAKILAKRNGFNAYGLSCSTPASVLINNYIREYFAVIKTVLIDLGDFKNFLGQLLMVKSTKFSIFEIAS